MSNIIDRLTGKCMPVALDLAKKLWSTEAKGNGLTDNWRKVKGETDDHKWTTENIGWLANAGAVRVHYDLNLDSIVKTTPFEPGLVLLPPSVSKNLNELVEAALGATLEEFDSGANLDQPETHEKIEANLQAKLNTLDGFEVGSVEDGNLMVNAIVNSAIDVVKAEFAV